MTNRYRLPWFIAALLTALLLILIGLGWWRSNGTGPQVQVPMFYDAHYLFPRAWTQAQAAPGVPNPAPLAFYGPNRVSQTFVSASDRLSMVEVWLHGKPGEAVDVSLVDDQGRNVSGKIVLRGAPDGDRYRLAFEPFEDARGGQFTLTLLAPEATIEDPVVTRMVGGDRLNGAFRLNEYNRPGNLELLAYASGWPGRWWLDAVGEQILPSIFRLRLEQYKPEHFKGILFPSLTVLTAGLSILFLALASPQAKEQMKRVSTLVGWSIVIVLALFLSWQIADRRVVVKLVTHPVTLEGSDEAISKAPIPDSAPRIANDLVADLWAAERFPEARFVDTDLIAGYPGIRVPADSRLEYSMNMLPNTRFRTGTTGQGQGELRVTIKADEQTIASESVSSKKNPKRDDIKWLELDLNAWAGSPIKLILETEGDTSETEGWWIMPQLVTSADWILADPMLDVDDFHATSIFFNDGVELTGYRVMPSKPQAGEALEVELYWRPLEEVEAYGKVFIHVLDKEGNLIAQDDSQPVHEAYPIPLWQPGTIIADIHILNLPADLAAGEYSLAIGLYDPVSLERWEIQDADGKNLADRRVVLTNSIEVVP